MLTTTEFSISRSQLTTTVCSVKSPEPPVEASRVCTHTAIPLNPMQETETSPVWLFFSSHMHASTLTFDMSGDQCRPHPQSSGPRNLPEGRSPWSSFNLRNG